VIDAFIFPNTDDCVRESLANLSRIGRVRFGNASSGMPILEIVNWEKHQRVDKPQTRVALPPINDIEQETCTNTEKSTVRESFANHSGTARESFATLPTTYDLRPTTRDQGTGSEENKAATAPRNRVAARPSIGDVQDYIREAGLTQTDPEAFLDHYAANGWKQSNGNTITDWKAAARNWNRRQPQYSAKSRSGPLKGQDLIDANAESSKRLLEKIKNGTAGDLFEMLNDVGSGQEPPNHRVVAGSVLGRIGGSNG